ncbi:unnamed protein product [Anisakis simplex]|uniref:Chromo domain-containing protein n=1 Tax=Anisakis simplex TaxID=6269 RepID=A0A0M3K3B4_ANISI|nr:unnamed protein product [Anisakis simplex]
MEGTITNLNESGDSGKTTTDAQNTTSDSTEAVEMKTDVSCAEEVQKETEVSNGNADHSPDDEEKDQRDGDSSGLDEDEYEVERILGVKIDEGMLKYEVRWKGYGSGEDSWEPEENLESARLILDEYIANNIEKRKNLKAPKRSNRRSNRVSDPKVKLSDSDTDNDDDASDRMKEQKKEENDNGGENSSNESDDDDFASLPRPRKKKKKTIQHPRATRESSRRGEEPISKEPCPRNPKYAWLYDDTEDVELDDDSERKNLSKKENETGEVSPRSKKRSVPSSTRSRKSPSKESDPIKRNSSNLSIDVDEQVKRKRETITSEMKKSTNGSTQNGCVSDPKGDEQFEIAGVLKLECGSVKVLCRKNGDTISELVSVQEMVKRDALKFVNYLLSRGVFSQDSTA